MAWKKVSPELSDLLDQAVAQFPAEKKKMFGCPMYFVNNNMYTGVHGEGIILRLPEDLREKILVEYDEATLFEPMPGRFMREYIVLPQTVYEHPEILTRWLKFSFDFVSSLPPKVKKSKSKK